MMKQKIEIYTLSEHLFWDVNAKALDPEKNSKLIIHRTLDYGLLTDWKTVYNYYGIGKITEIATKIKDLDKRSMSLIMLLSNTPKEAFACYTTKQLTPKHWDF